MDVLLPLFSFLVVAVFWVLGKRIDITNERLDLLERHVQDLEDR